MEFAVIENIPTLFLMLQLWQNCCVTLISNR
jgi:hypothetical protein